MYKTRPFRMLTFTTYMPLPIIGIMAIFGIMGQLLNIGWLQSAPDVLMIPMLLLYYISLVMGAIYGYMKQEESVYLMAVGGAAYLVAQAIKAARVVAFPELGMEAIYEFELEDMPVTVAVDHTGESVHQTGPKLWAEKISQRVVNFNPR